MTAPLTVKRNNYKKNRKNNSQETPLPLSRWLQQLVDEATEGSIDSVTDPCCGTGNLLTPWRETGIHTVGIDITERENVAKQFYRGDFLSSEEGSRFHTDFVVCNPPYNQKKEGRKLLPELFLKRIFEVFGWDVPVMLFTPMGFILNQRMKSKRYRYFRDDCRARLTGRIALPLDIFPGVEFHQEILLWNLPEMQPFYWVPEEVIQLIEKERYHG